MQEQLSFRSQVQAWDESQPTQVEDSSMNQEESTNSIQNKGGALSGNKDNEWGEPTDSNCTYVVYHPIYCQEDLQLMLRLLTGILTNSRLPNLTCSDAHCLLPRRSAAQAQSLDRYTGQLSIAKLTYSDTHLYLVLYGSSTWCQKKRFFSN